MRRVGLRPWLLWPLRIFSALAMLAAVAAVAFYLTTDQGWRSIVETKFSIFWMSAAVLATLVYLLGYFLVWDFLLRLENVRLPPALSFGIWGVSNAAKYLPGKIFGPGYKIAAIVMREQIDPRRIGWASVHEQALSVVGGLAAFVLFGGIVASGYFDSSPMIGYALAAAGTIVLVLAALTLMRGRGRLGKLLDSVDGAPARSGVYAAKLALAFACYFGLWIGLGAIILLAARALDVRLSLHFATFTASLSGLAGMLNVIAPSGLGVRDATLAGLVTTVSGSSTAVLIALVARGASLAGDLVTALAGFASLSVFDRRQARMAQSQRRHPLEDTVLSGRCIGCGFCSATFKCADQAVKVEMVPDEDLGVRPAVSGWSPGKDIGSYVCPGDEMDMPSLADQVYGRQPPDPVLGEIVSVRAAWATDDTLRREASSGGVIPAVLTHLFLTGRIDAAYAMASPGGAGALDAEGALLRSADDVSRIHGSVYHPRPFGRELAALLSGSDRFAFVGLPCDVASLRRVMAERPDVAQRCVLTVALFCGGLNRLAGVDYYLRTFGVTSGELSNLRYRRGAWPGDMEAQVAGSTAQPIRIPRVRRNSRWRVMRYMAAFQGFWMLKRCRICPDQVGDFADVSVGDPHGPRFRKLAEESGGRGASVVLARSAAGEAYIEACLNAGVLGQAPLTREEAVESQGYTLDNRRQAETYMRMERRLGGAPPRVRGYAASRVRLRAYHAVFALVDLLKLRLERCRVLYFAFPFIQAADYLFLRFPPLLFGRRLMNLIRNR